MLDSDWSRKILLRSDWSVLKGASITTRNIEAIEDLIQDRARFLQDKCVTGVWTITCNPIFM